PFFDEFSASLPGAPGSVALWHSRLSERERREAWLGLRSGRVRVVVGARSACLLPFRDLRLAVMDEEQDESFKQDGQSPFYHARDVVLERAASFGATVVLGSATPSVDTYARARSGEYRLIEMPQRVSSRTQAPVVRILDRSSVPSRCITPGLLEAVKARLERREQVILLVNRRGFSNFIVCRRCAWVARCAVCQVAFIHHHPSGGSPSLLCHHCGRRAEVPASCGRCAQGPVAFAGAGTQRVVSEIKSLLPGVRVLRLDRDTASSSTSEDHGAYRRFLNGEADILVGTKLVAKGFHFPRVTLVGIVDADTMLQMPDFRSAERTVQLLVQAAGRAGRADMPGEVLLQTSQPTHYAIQAAARGDYSGFSLEELGHRATFRYPPASTLVRIVFIAKTEDGARRAADSAARQLRAGLGAPGDARPQVVVVRRGE
ncbi:MAG: primosomal protein N', partial [Elusimicrobiota bacterium]